jgi:hypothetical protein
MSLGDADGPGCGQDAVNQAWLRRREEREQIARLTTERDYWKERAIAMEKRYDELLSRAYKSSPNNVFTQSHENLRK